MSKDNTHQLIMNKAYDRWQKNAKVWDKFMFFDQLDFQERVAVSLGNLNYQVENGGFSQWKYNGLADVHLDFLLRLDVDKNLYPEISKALELLSKFKKADEELSDKDNYSDDEDEDEEFENELERVFDNLDTSYYKLENIEVEMNKLIESIK